MKERLDLIPGKNDSDEWVKNEAEWIASLDPGIPLHLTRYFPRWKYTEPATPRGTLYRLQKIAEQYLRYVYVGNV